MSEDELTKQALRGLLKDRGRELVELPGGQFGVANPGDSAEVIEQRARDARGALRTNPQLEERATDIRNAENDSDKPKTA